VLISAAYAQTAGAQPQGGGYEQIIMMVLMFGALWFFMVRPQMRRAKELKAMNEALQKGDEVITQGGIVGRISKLGDDYVRIEVAEGTEIVVQRPAVQVLLPKGTLKSL
jgi:preprotein translocase subunit YajC